MVREVGFGIRMLYITTVLRFGNSNFPASTVWFSRIVLIPGSAWNLVPEAPASTEALEENAIVESPTAKTRQEPLSESIPGRAWNEGLSRSWDRTFSLRH
jgi:hypothetical protein